MTNGIDHHGKHPRGQQTPAKKRRAKKAAAKAASPKAKPASWIAKAVQGGDSGAQKG